MSAPNAVYSSCRITLPGEWTSVTNSTRSVCGQSLNVTKASATTASESPNHAPPAVWLSAYVFRAWPNHPAIMPTLGGPIPPPPWEGVTLQW